MLLEVGAPICNIFHFPRNLSAGQKRSLILLGRSNSCRVCSADDNKRQKPKLKLSETREEENLLLFIFPNFLRPEAATSNEASKRERVRAAASKLIVVFARRAASEQSISWRQLPPAPEL